MTTFAQMKKNRRKDFEEISAKAETLTTTKKKFEKDPRFWELTKDENGEGNAVIRYLQVKDYSVTNQPRVKLYEWSLKGPKGWFIAYAPHSINLPDPVYEYRGKLYESGNKEAAKLINRNIVYISNILVIKDPAHPENNGKVKLHKYTNGIATKQDNLQNPPEKDEEKINPFDYWDGKNLKLRLKKPEAKGGEKVIATYASSEWADKSAIGTDAEIEAIWNQLYDLNEFKKPEFFKSYVELEKWFYRAMDLPNPSEGKVARLEKTEAKEDPSDPPWEPEQDSSDEPGLISEDDGEEDEEVRALLNAIK